jgi:TetR/AcrR family transcriptional regulator, mexJK operon transcriptional repressor
LSKRLAAGRTPEEPNDARPHAFVPKRGRPTAAQVEAINRTILSAATDQFLSAGFEAAAMEVIAAQAGVSKGTLYARFSTKEALLHAVIEDHVADWSAEAGRDDHLLPPALEDRLRYHARTIMRSFSNAEIRAFERLVRGPGVAREVAKDFYETAQRFAVRVLAREIEEGTKPDPVPARNPERVAEMLIAMLYGWFHLEEGVRTIPEAEALAYADQAVDLLFAGRTVW